MKMLIGVLMVVAGVVLGLYVGGWICFIGGIVDVIQAIRAESLIAIDVAVGVGKVFFAGVAGWLSFALLGIPGIAIFQSS